MYMNNKGIIKANATMNFMVLGKWMIANQIWIQHVGNFARVREDVNIGKGDRGC